MALQGWGIDTRGVINPLFYKDPLYFLPFFSVLISYSLSPPGPTPNAFFAFLFPLLNGSSRQIWWAILLNIMDLHISSLRILICVISNKVSGLLRSDRYCGFLLVLLFDITHTKTHRQLHSAHSGANRLTHPNRHILKTTVMCSEQLSFITLNK